MANVLIYRQQTKGVEVMKFTFTEKNIEVPVEAKEYAEKKIGKLEKYFRGEAAAFVTFGFKRGRYTVEAVSYTHLTLPTMAVV